MAKEKNNSGENVNDIPLIQSEGTDSKHEVGENGSEASLEYPEGGTRAWLVVSGASAVMFCTFGYLTGFG